MTARAYPVIPSDRSDDLHHLEIAEKADLILFMAGNQFMAMPEIVSAFKTQYPEIEKIRLSASHPIKRIHYHRFP